MGRAKEYFMANVKKSVDLEDNLQELVEFVQEQTGATGVYVGKLQYPEREIAVDADDKAHFDAEASRVVKFIHANQDHSFMTGAVLEPHVGITHEVFGEGYQRQDRFQIVRNEDGSEESRTELGLFDRFKHIYVKEVVREPRMNYQRVPKLGSYMAIPLVY